MAMRVIHFEENGSGGGGDFFYVKGDGAGYFKGAVTMAAGYKGSVSANNEFVTVAEMNAHVPAGGAALVQATETKIGAAEIATQAEVNAGADSTRIVTPSTLKTYVGAKITITPTATTSRHGTVELATAAEVGAGTDTTRAVTPKTLKDQMSSYVSSHLPTAATTSAKGIIELATTAETKTGTDAARAVTPKALKDAGYLTELAKNISGNGYLKLGDGLTIQWGQSSSSTGQHSVTFPTAFAAVYAITCLPEATSFPTAGAHQVQIKSHTNTAVTFIHSNATAKYHWIAIGK